MNNDEYFISSGEFIKLCQTTRDTLRYYDKMGLLVPKKSDENGYNYYSYRQIATFYFINFYRTLGCSVKDLKVFINNRKSDEFDKLLYEQRDALLKEKEELEHNLSLVMSGIEIMSHIRNNPDGQVMIERYDKSVKVALTDVTSEHGTSFDDIANDILVHIDRCNLNKNIRTFPMGAVMSYDDFHDGRYYYKKIFSMAEKSSKNMNIITLPSKIVVSCVNQDSTEPIESVYQRICDFIDEKRLTPLSDVYSLSLVNLVDTHDLKRYLKYIFVCV